VTDGNYRVVIMNTDASPGLAIDGRFSLTLPWLFGIGLGSLALGIPIAVAGLVLLAHAGGQSQPTSGRATPAVTTAGR
jgi:hypothetical protein